MNRFNFDVQVNALPLARDTHAGVWRATKQSIVENGLDYTFVKRKRDFPPYTGDIPDAELDALNRGASERPVRLAVSVAVLPAVMDNRFVVGIDDDLYGMREEELRDALFDFLQEHQRP